MADVDMADEAVVEGEYHVQQLVGLAVVDTSGNAFGELADVLNLPGQDVLAINTPTGEVLIPFVKEFVPTVDLENRKITIAPPEGLLGVADE
jgi:16S rRNA processing protein RimM